MDIRDYKSYWPFVITVILFVVIAVYSLSIYFKWGISTDEVQTQVEVNLPVIDWNKYTVLSKQYQPDNLN
jgi:hypothetical protein